MEKSSLLSKAALKRLGWTDKMIDVLLPDPILKTNPMFKSAAPMKMWEQGVVDDVMKTDKYKDFLKKTELRKNSAKKSVDTKLKKFDKLIQKAIADITIEFIPNDDTLREFAVASKQEWNNYIAFSRGDIPDNASLASSETIDRWVVNFIRHELTSYDESLLERAGKTGCRNGYITYKNAILMKISEMYPKYKDECIRQMISDD